MNKRKKEEDVSLLSIIKSPWMLHKGNSLVVVPQFGETEVIYIGLDGRKGLKF